MAKTPLDRLANLGEEVLGKAAQNPNLSRVVQTAVQLRDRVDDLTKRVRGLEAMEKRIATLEERVAKLEKPPKKTTPTKKTS
jgi:BMFP domain-containing protein YqiC